MSSGSTRLTWSLLGASALTLGLAAHLALAENEDPARSPAGAPAEANLALPSASTSAPDHPPGDNDDPPSVPQQTNALLSSPYDLAHEMVDAQRRARIWDMEACLSGMRVVMRGGARQELEITYGQANGRARPLAKLTSRRMTYTYRNAQLDSAVETKAGGSGRCLPEPNCPWQAATVAAKDAGVHARAEAGGVYLYSSKYDRGVWTISAPGHNVSHVDGDSCTLLRR